MRIVSYSYIQWHSDYLHPSSLSRCITYTRIPDSLLTYVITGHMPIYNACQLCHQDSATRKVVVT